MLTIIDLHTTLERTGLEPFKIHLDFETFSESDLKSVGGFNYARHASTRVTCYAISIRFANNDYYLDSWNPNKAHPSWMPQLLATGCAIAAFNWVFEFYIWHYVLRRDYPELPVLDYLRFDCTAARARSNSIGRSLDTVAQAMRLEHQKDSIGYKVMLQLCKPKRASKKDPNTYYAPELYPEKYAILEEYCRSDVMAEMAVDAALPPWRPEELAIFQLDKKINMRGVPIDRDTCRLALSISQQAKVKYNTELYHLTGVSSASEVMQLTAWIRLQGVECESLDAENCREMLLRSDIPADVRRAVEIREALSKSSVAKISKMLALAADHGHARDTLVYAGAIGTLRWSGDALQPQNIPRGKSKPARVLAAVESIKTGRLDVVEFLHGDATQTISDCIRAMIAAPPGTMILAADYSNIESRILFHLAGERAGLQLYRDKRCVYCDMAATVYATDYDTVWQEYKAGDGGKRNIGKAAILGLGYQMGGPKFLDTIETQSLTYDPALGDFINLRGKSLRQWRATREHELQYKQTHRWVTELRGPHVIMPNGITACVEGMTAAQALRTMQEAQTDKVKQDYRDKFAAVPKLWAACNIAAMQAVRSPGEYVPVGFGGLAFYVRGDWLSLEMPGDGYLSWYRPILKTIINQFGNRQEQLFYEHLNSVTKKWELTATYGGKLVENIVQSYARRILAYAMLRADAAGFDIFMHVHDEPAVLVAEGADQAVVDYFCNLICELPTWAEGLPLAASGWIGPRYKKD